MSRPQQPLDSPTLQGRLVDFIHILRSHDIRISPAETLDAVAVASALGFGDRGQLRDGLAITLAKSGEEERIFYQCFDRYFSFGTEAAEETETSGEAQAAGTPDADQLAEPGQASDAGAGAASDAGQLAAAAETVPEVQAALDSDLLQQLMNNERAALSMALRRAADAVGLSDIRMFTQKGQFSRRMLDQMGESQLRDAVIALERQNNPAVDVMRRYRDLLREQVRDAVEREYLVQAGGRNRQQLDDILSRTRLSHIERHYVDRVQEVVRRMARKLASRYSRRRRTRRRGQLDMSRTLRAGIPHDGTLFQTHWRHRRRDRARVVALCDVSGSVAAYAKFLLIFLYSLQDVLPRMRSFAFSSHLGEVSDIFEEYPVERAVELVNWRFGGATDYGGSLRDFARLALNDINRDTSVIILGDARNNKGEPELGVMQAIYARSKQVIWLNPESRRAWGTGDSEMLRYQVYCSTASECSTLRQLERVVDQLIRSTR